MKKHRVSPQQAIKNKAWLDAEYKTFENTVKSAVCFVLSTAIIIFDKRIDMTDMMHQQEQKYGFSFNDVVVHIESKTEFVKGVKEDG